MSVSISAIFAKHKDWPAVKAVADKLVAKGYLAYLAGGCVRDSLLQKVPHDFDLATDARPEDVIRLFPKTIPVGKAFGVVVVRVGETSIEVATFRSDGAYVDGRHPTSITYSSPRADAERRDFTVNSLFYDLVNDRMIDYVGGRKDLEKRCLRTVGPATLRFTEDRLRILRAVRFAAQLGFVIDEKTQAAVRALAPMISKVSAERVRAELDRILLGPRWLLGLQLLVGLKLWLQIVPEVRQPMAERSGWSATLRALLFATDAPMRLSTFWAWLFLREQRCQRGKEALSPFIARLRSLTYPTSLIREVDWLSTHFPPWRSRLGQPLSDREVRRRQFECLDHEAGLGLLELLSLNYWTEASEGDIDSASVLISEYLPLSDPRGHLRGRLIKGEDLLIRGVPPGPSFGQLLEDAYAEQILQNWTERDIALAWLDDRLGAPSGSIRFPRPSPKK